PIPHVNSLASKLIDGKGSGGREHDSDIKIPACGHDIPIQQRKKRPPAITAVGAFASADMRLMGYYFARIMTEPSLPLANMKQD
ncbi:hypothetical protein, partial [Skermanella aerolata]|uniref:hypothetical protein n=2 Tax=Skermanella aerolata TaxID=393310 RepID=UPI001B3B7DCD